METCLKVLHLHQVALKMLLSTAIAVGRLGDYKFQISHSGEQDRYWKIRNRSKCKEIKIKIFAAPWKKKVCLSHQNRDKQQKWKLLKINLNVYNLIKIWRQINQETVFFEYQQTVQIFLTLENAIKRKWRKQRKCQSFFATFVSLPDLSQFQCYFREIFLHSNISIRVNQNITLYNQLHIFKIMIKFEHKKIGSYIILTNKRVAQLKHSNIFLGLNTLTKKKVLIKIVSKAQYLQNDVLRNSFNFEMHLTTILKEENILKPLQILQTEKNYYMILEQPHGLSFKKMMAEKGVLRERQVRVYLRRLRSTFCSLYEKNIIHGNINSKSTLINHNRVILGYPSYVKTIQVMKVNSLKDQSFFLVQEYQKKNQYSHLPPELLATGMVSLKHDIWSLGVLVYELLFGSLPWEMANCHTPLEMAQLMINHPVSLIKSNHLSKQMKHFLVNCLQIDPFKRIGWEQALSHAIFTQDIESIGEPHTADDKIGVESLKFHDWQLTEKTTQSHFNFTQ